MPPRSARRLAPLALIVITQACAAPAPMSPRAHAALVAFDQRGGDVWAFERRLAGRADRACRAVRLIRGAAEVSAAIDDGRFAAIVPLASGENDVTARCQGRDGRTLAEAVVRLRVRLEARPTARVRVSATVGEAIALDAGASTRTVPTKAPLVRYRWHAREGNPEPLRLTTGEALDGASAERVELARPSLDGEYYVSLEIEDARGARDRAASYFTIVHGRAYAADTARGHPAWVDRAVVYGAVPQLFGTPPLEAVTERLPLLASLGVTTLWLTPVQASPPGDFGYEVLDHFTMREDLGAPEDLEALVDEAHARGLRVLLDFVPNHTSREHAYFRDAEAYGERSPYYGFYERDASGEPSHYFDWEHLPSLDFDEPEVRRMILEAAAHWVRRFDVDGYRVDVAWGVDERAPELFAAMRAELTRIKPDVMLLAEASARFPHYFQAGFDAAYDWTDEVGRWAWADVFQHGRVDLGALTRALTADGRGFPEDAIVFRFLENNDTGERFTTVNGAGMHRVASALLFTVPGIPSLFTGEEVAAEYEPYQRETPLTFEPDPERFRHLARLASLRREEPALRGSLLVPLEVEPAESVYAFLRWPSGEGRPLLVVLAFQPEPVVARVHLDAAAREALGPRLADRLDEGPPPTPYDGGLRVALEPWGARVLGPLEASGPPTARSARTISARRAEGAPARRASR